MATTYDIARRAGVSQPAVSWVLNGRWKERRIAAATRSRILKAAAELKYQPNRLASGLRSKKSNLIGLVVREFRDPLLNQINQELIGDLERRGFEILITDVPELSDSKRIEELCAHQVEGLIVGPYYNSTFSPFLRRLAARGFPLAIFFQTSSLPCDSVTIDSENAAYQATRHLIQQGHGRIGCVISMVPHPQVDGYRRAMEEAGLPIRPDWILERIGYAEQGMEAGKTIATGDAHPTAYFIHGELIAAGFIRALCDRRIRVPQDVAVVANGDSSAAATNAISISTIRIPIRSVAEGIVERLMARIEKRPVQGWQRLTLQGELVVRESSATRRGAI